MNLNKLKLYFYGINYVLKSLFFRKELPFIGGIVINDNCNLHCQHCFVSNRNIPDLSFNEIKEGLLCLYKMGIRNLYIEGGEPFLWKDNSKNINNIIQLARDMGFIYITLYTNGTFPIVTKADCVFISIDGPKNVHDLNRGKTFDKIISNINTSCHKRIIANYTITKKNEKEIETFCNEVSKIKKIKGIFFYFYTPYKGEDSLFLNKIEKQIIIKRIYELKKKGFKILNSKSALQSVYEDNWKRPNELSYLYAENKLFKCCRSIEENDICSNCGYLGFTEIFQIAKLNPNTILSAIKNY